MDYEVAIIGAGPAGLQAAISAATDGLSVVVIEKGRVGGAIRHTPRLENVAFVAPGGCTGEQFADTMEENARSFGVSFIDGAVRSLEQEGDHYRVHYARTDEFRSVTAKFVVLAIGGRWKDIHVKGVMSGIHGDTIQYGPAGARNDWTGKDVVVVGGGPAAGQCIAEAAKTARSVRVLLKTGWTAPQYLVDRCQQADNVRVHKNVAIEEFHEEDGSRWVHYSLPHLPGQVQRAPADHTFLCAGVIPDTGWLKHGPIALHESGKVQTQRPSLMTDVDNVFAIGDCRDGSTARVCSALGDGSSVITEIHAIRNKAPMLPHKERK